MSDPRSDMDSHVGLSKGAQPRGTRLAPRCRVSFRHGVVPPPPCTTRLEVPSMEIAPKHLASQFRFGFGLPVLKCGPSDGSLILAFGSLAMFGFVWFSYIRGP